MILSRHMTPAYRNHVHALRRMPMSIPAQFLQSFR